jgi:hypothetical protein
VSVVDVDDAGGIVDVSVVDVDVIDAGGVVNVDVIDAGGVVDVSVIDAGVILVLKLKQQNFFSSLSIIYKKNFFHY